jgi:hypothetical protein
MRKISRIFFALLGLGLLAITILPFFGLSGAVRPAAHFALLRHFAVGHAIMQRTGNHH